MSNGADDKKLKQIAMILNQAENTPHEAERETAMKMAQSLATKHGIDLAIARQFTKSGEKAKQNDVQVVRVEIGTQGDRGSGTYSDLMISIAEANEIMWLRGDNNSWVELYGMKFDIEYAQNLYAVLLVQMVDEMNEFLYEGDWKDEGVTRSEARQSFSWGYRHKIKERLVDARLEAERQAQKDHDGDGISVALVLADQRQEIKSTYWSARRGLKSYNPGAGRSRVAREKGRESGARANLHDKDAISARKSIG